MERLVKMGTGDEYEGAKPVSPRSQPAPSNLVFVVASLAPKEIVIQSSNWKHSLKHGAQTGQRTLTILLAKDAV